MSTVLQCPHLDCAINREGVCDMARVQMAKAEVAVWPAGMPKPAMLACTNYKPREAQPNDRA